MFYISLPSFSSIENQGLKSRFSIPLRSLNLTYVTSEFISPIGNLTRNCLALHSIFTHLDYNYVNLF